MIINRKRLANILQVVEPALTTGDWDARHCFWFDGERVSATNGRITISVALKTDFVGGVFGRGLLDFVKTTTANEIELVKNDSGGHYGHGTLRVAAGAANVEFDCRADEVIRPAELPEGAVGYPITEEFLEAVKLTLISVGTGKVMTPEQRGITVIQNGAAADLYTTDAVTISRMRVATGNHPIITHRRALFPTDFCERLLALDPLPGARLVVSEQRVWCIGTTHRAADVLLWSGLVADDDPVAIAGVFAGYLKQTGTSIPIPPRFKAALRRILPILGIGEPADLSIFEDPDAGHVLRLHGQGSFGNFDEIMRIPPHRALTVRTDVALLARGAEVSDLIAVTKDCVVMTGPRGFQHIVATK